MFVSTSTYQKNASFFLGSHQGSLKTAPKNLLDAYPFGFNGQEKDNELKGKGNHNTAEFWQYDTRLGRRWNLDPVDQISISNYACFGNNPIWFTDVKGDSIKMDKNFAESRTSTKALKQILNTKEGYRQFAKFASKGQEILGFKFEKDGEFAKKDIDIEFKQEYDNSAGGASGDSYFDEKNKTFELTIYSDKKADVGIINKQSVFQRAETILHERFIHGEFMVNDYLKDGKINNDNISQSIKTSGAGEINWQHSKVSIEFAKGIANHFPYTQEKILKQINTNLRLGMSLSEIRNTMWDFVGSLIKYNKENQPILYEYSK